MADVRPAVDAAGPTVEIDAPDPDGLVTIHGRKFHMTKAEKHAAANPAWRVTLAGGSGA